MTFACLGLEWLGSCSYDPAAPPNLYFSLGEAVGALAFTLALQQFFRPIYRFRLSVRFVPIRGLYALIFGASLLVVISAIVPHLAFLGGGWWRYPVIWELLATALFITAYAVVALAIVFPVQVSERRIDDFARGAARILSSSNENDRLDLVPDLELSVSVLASSARFLENGRRERTAFYEFTHRYRIEQASFAQSLLSILADESICRTLVKSAPWSVARILNDLSEKKIRSSSAEHLVRELSRQAILEDESMLTREIDYVGFATAPLLSDALYSDYFILDAYNPMDFFASTERTTGATMKRYNAAAQRVVLTLIENEDTDHSYAGVWVPHFYESAFFEAYKQQKNPTDQEFMFQLTKAIEQADQLALRLMAGCDQLEYESMYVTDPEVFRSDLLEQLVKIAFEGICSFANGFNGLEDPFWHTVSKITRIFDKFGEQPDGMTPFQQRLALQIVEKVKDNMKGFYPALTRVMLMAMGPYEEPGRRPNKHAFNILLDALYGEWKSFPDLAQKDRARLPDYLPPSVTLEGTVLTRTYLRGETRSTDLATIAVPEVSLLDAKWRRPLTAGEREQATHRIF